MIKSPKNGQNPRNKKSNLRKNIYFSEKNFKTNVKLFFNSRHSLLRSTRRPYFLNHLRCRLPLNCMCARSGPPMSPICFPCPLFPYFLRRRPPRWIFIRTSSRSGQPGRPFCFISSLTFFFKFDYFFRRNIIFFEGLIFYFFVDFNF